MFDGVTVVGGGLAGCECACQLADRGIDVRLIEMRPVASSPAHHTDGLAELVCSNSFKSLREDSAAGMLKRELSDMGSVLVSCAKRASVPAGGALAVDRDAFSRLVEEEVASRDRIVVIREEVVDIPEARRHHCRTAMLPGALREASYRRRWRSLVLFRCRCTNR